APAAYNLGMNCGQHAGQTVFHFHLHLIPRYAGDNKGRNSLRGLREYIREIL
ncbi:MAG TPA: HIT family protein, partial [Candidatus Cloacimonadota bacterium]|nr:HIT family protein [Candidatus Cloacimonadota bacterium]